jgi:TldD protein
MKTAKRISSVFLSFVLCALSGSLFAQEANHASPAAALQQDPVLRAMSLELQRSKEQLRLENMQRPYYIEYSVVDRETYGVDAAFGAVRQESRRRMRFIDAEVRIGDYRQDSFYSEGQGSIDIAPMEDNVEAIRHQLWLTTDTAYKAAIRAYTEKQALLKQFEGNDNPTDDFSREKPSQYIGPVARIDFDSSSLRDAVADATGLYREHESLQSLDGRVAFVVQTHYYMNSEGTVLRQPDVQYTVTIRGNTQAADGMRLDRDHTWAVATPRELPTASEVRNATEKLIASLEELRVAPVVDDEYRGPVLFSAGAANDVFATMVANAVLGRKPRPGQTSRTVGEYASSFKGRVLPEFLTLVDDPTVQTYAGRTLAGSYVYDDEGVKAQRVDVIDKGKLINYLIGRQPIRDFPESNGHGRGSGIGATQPHIGNLFIKSLQPQSFASMKQKLIEMCRDAGLPYGYVVESIAGGMAPEVMRRVWVKDGREELVRGAEFHQLDPRALRSDLIAAGDDFQVDNVADSVGASIIGPSVLFGELQIRRSSQAKDKLPDYPPPGTKLALQNAAPVKDPIKDKNRTKEGQ